MRQLQLILVFAFLILCGDALAQAPETTIAAALAPAAVTTTVAIPTTPAMPVVAPASAVPATSAFPSLPSLLSPAITAAPAAAAKTTTSSTATALADTVEEGEETEETFGARMLDFTLDFADATVKQGEAFFQNFNAAPQVNDWLRRQSADPYAARWRTTGFDLPLTAGAALAAAFVLELLLLPVRRHIRRRPAPDFLRRLAGTALLLTLELLPVLLFIGLALALLDQLEAQRLPRFVALNVVYVIIMIRLVMLFGQALLAPRTPALRLFPLSSELAKYLYRWLGAFTVVAVAGYFVVDVARGIKIPGPAVDAFGSLLGLLLVAMTITVIVQKRGAVAVLLRGELSAARPGLSAWQSLRLWFARNWHIIAIAYLVVGYAVTALGVEGGFGFLLRGTVLTFLILLVFGLVSYGIGRVAWHPVLQFFLRLAAFFTAALGVAAAWGANIPALFATSFGQRITGSLFSIGVTTAIVALLYKLVSGAIEGHLNRQDHEGKLVQTSARVRTLLPMIRNAAFIIFAAVVALVVLSEAGVNIGPLLAGAGVIGVAVGFGSQTLVKDFLTGFFIVVENTVAIGDNIKIGDHAGVVEAMTIRTLRLRDGDGALHILPFGEADKIVNMSRDFSMMTVSVGVSYKTDLARAMDIMREVGEELKEDQKLRHKTIGKLDILGVDEFGPVAIKLMAQMKVKPNAQPDVRRAFLFRLKQRFDKEGIEIPSVNYIPLPGK